MMVLKMIQDLCSLRSVLFPGRSVTIPSLRHVAVMVTLICGQALEAVPHRPPFTIVLIGGDKQGYPRTEHDYPDGILAIERLIAGSPQLQALNPAIKAFPSGFPKDLSQISDADVVVVYFGNDYRTPRITNPVEDPAHLAAMKELMARGAGLIALHQAFTIADETSPIPYSDWLGAVRVGMADRSTELVPVEVNGEGNPVANGLKAFNYLDEFYPTLSFSKSIKVTPILTARLHVQSRNNKYVFEEPPKNDVIAWTAERSNGGRSFGFTGAHYLATLDQPKIRTMLLNAILWTSKHEVPPDGVTTSAVTMRHYGNGHSSSVVQDQVLLPKSEALVEVQPWGKLEWFASRALGNSSSMTVGIATLSVGKRNPLHRHPNCDEVLHVIGGHIISQVGEKEYDMNPGDTLTIHEGTWHDARNIGNQDAILSISFSSPDRLSIVKDSVK